MRTYTRKRQEYQIIEDVHQLCRLCMNKLEQPVPIFANDTEVCTSLAMRIMICIGLEISQEECLPNAICIKCYEELNKYYDFRKKCSLTYQRLKSHTLAVKALEKQKTLVNNVLETDNEPGEIIDNESLTIFSEGDQMEISINNKIEEHFTIEQSILSKVNSDENNANQILDDLIAPNISEFLATILLKLNILAKKDEKYVMTDLNEKTIELETGDGCQIILELLENEEEPPTVDMGLPVNMQLSDNLEPPSISVGPHVNMRSSTDLDSSAVDLMPPVISAPSVSLESSSVNLEQLPINLGLQANYESSLNLEPCIGRVNSEYITSNNSLDLETTPKQIVDTRPSCPDCGKRFASLGVVRRHARVHTGERPYVCRACPRRFAQREVLRRHELVHQERRPFACGSCPKSFTQRGALVSHARSHAPPHARALALHRCDKCPKLFLHASGLSRHQAAHSGRVFSCGQCARHFRDSSALLRHARRTHALDTCPAPDTHTTPDTQRAPDTHTTPT